MQKNPKKRGRPPVSNTPSVDDATPDTKRPRGRPPKTPVQEPIVVKKTPVVAARKKTPVVAARKKTPVVATRNKTPVVPKRNTPQKLTLHDKINELSKDIHTIKNNVFQIYDMFATFVENHQNDDDEEEEEEEEDD